jgi:hypothetical protein
MTHKSKCSICGGDLPIPKYDGDTPPKLNGKPICYPCWGIEHENKTTIIINYRMRSYVQGQETVMEHTSIRLDQLPSFIDTIFRKPGYSVEFVLLEEGCG